MLSHWQCLCFVALVETSFWQSLHQLKGFQGALQPFTDLLQISAGSQVAQIVHSHLNQATKCNGRKVHHAVPMTNHQMICGATDESLHLLI